MEWNTHELDAIAMVFDRLESILERQKQLLSTQTASFQEETEEEAHTEDVGAWQESMEEYFSAQAEVDGLRKGRSLPSSMRAQLERLQQLQKENEQLLHQRLAGLRQDLKKMRTGRQGRQAYYGPGPSSGGAFVDQKK